jgi:hypothetical protein
VRGLTLGLAAATCWKATALLAQTAPEQKESQVWGLQGLRAGYCVRFLMDPRAASEQLRSGYRLLRADQDSTLHSALRHSIEAQPEHSSWVPSRVCFYFTDAVQLGQRRLTEKGNRYQMLAAWTVAATDQKAGARRDIAVDLYASRRSLLRGAEASGVRVRDAHSVVDDDAGADSMNVYSVRLERTLLVWHGRTSGDSTRVSQPIQESWVAPGTRGRVWSVRFSMTPTWAQSLVGSLTVEGKGDLAKALKASPIRFVGPIYWQGNGELRFYR